ncbi:MAG: LysR family transcriptional regulator [Hyphomonas sp.]|uniref:LysR family transcriptional regulator n=1 Tax=Hyphomonas sp. TaxID=87 RepID=UPI0017ED5682|nr:LysR family transcriptional regulator [Hyphomonas sp.]MBA3069944.1 LysR family transcriptional regulator [Hyphomonas sp.]MBU3921667.1 LysR family transcriptional regulator [Alphaproteobacteria bacterium]MBU4060480.1 LysR family transcriptional regulator [Alphaproteobacteria bacterium]MBU4163148.1 LysR family transcriptional regulator [Alphaproteobacteria bacterium]
MSIDRLDWDSLRVFRVVAELSSMSAAATRLGESPPTISRKIDDLERNLGSQVFTRSTRGVELTDIGKQVLRYVHKMALEAENLQRETAATGALVTGSITLFTGDGLGPYWIAPRLARFHSANPKVQVRLIVREDTPDALTDDADISITYAEPRKNDLIAHRLGVQHYVGFASKDYIAEFGKPDSLVEYYKHRCILHTSYVNQVERWAPRMSELRRMVDFAFITNSGTAIAESCAKGGGIGILPSFMSVIDPRLVALELPEIAPIRFWITYTERVRRLPHGSLLIDWIRQLFASPEALWFDEEFVHPRDYAAKVRALHPQIRRES